MLGDINPREIRTTSSEPVVYRGRDNVVFTAVEQYDGRRYSPVDFSAVERMVLILDLEDGEQYVFDSELVSAVDWSIGGGKLFFELADYALANGLYQAKLVAYDAEHTNGQVVLDTLVGNTLTFEVREVFTAGTAPPPLSTGGESVVRSVDGPLSALRVVYERAGVVRVLDKDSDDIDFTLGITLSAASEAGDTVVVQRSGTIDDAGWTWTEGLVFLGSNGMLTQVPPLTGWELVVGFAPTPTRLNIDFDEPVLLA